MIDKRVASHRQFERLLKRIVLRTGFLPRYIFLSAVKRIGTNSVVGGGFADIWKGVVRGRLVALKVLRIFDHQLRREEIHKVSILISVTSDD